MTLCYVKDIIILHKNESQISLCVPIYNIWIHWTRIKKLLSKCQIYNDIITDMILKPQ